MRWWSDAWVLVYKVLIIILLYYVYRKNENDKTLGNYGSFLFYIGTFNRGR